MDEGITALLQCLTSGSGDVACKTINVSVVDWILLASAFGIALDFLRNGTQALIVRAIRAPLRNLILRFKALRLRHNRSADVLVVIAKIHRDLSEDAERRIADEIQSRLGIFLFDNSVKVSVRQLPIPLYGMAMDRITRRQARVLTRWINRSGATYLVWGRHQGGQDVPVRLWACRPQNSGDLKFLQERTCRLGQEDHFLGYIEDLVSEWLAEDMGSISGQASKTPDSRLIEAQERIISLRQKAIDRGDLANEIGISKGLVNITAEGARRGLFIESWWEAYRSLLHQLELTPRDARSERLSLAVSLARVARQIAWADGASDIAPAARHLEETLQIFEGDDPKLLELLEQKAWLAYWAPKLFHDDEYVLWRSRERMRAICKETPELGKAFAVRLHRLNALSTRDFVRREMAMSLEDYTWRRLVWEKAKVDTADVDIAFALVKVLSADFLQTATNEARETNILSQIDFLRGIRSQARSTRSLAAKSLDLRLCEILALSSINSEGGSAGVYGEEARKLAERLLTDKELVAATRLRFMLISALAKAFGGGGASPEEMGYAIEKWHEALSFKSLAGTETKVSLAVCMNNFCNRFNTIDMARGAIKLLEPITDQLDAGGMYVHAYSRYILADRLIKNVDAAASRADQLDEADASLMLAYEHLAGAHSRTPSAWTVVDLNDLQGYCDRTRLRLAEAKANS